MSFDVELYEVSEPLPTTWRTRDGRVLRLRDMTSSHLLNVLAMLRRNEDVYVLREVVSLSHFIEQHGETIAADAADEAVTELADLRPGEYIEAQPIYRAIRRELQRRERGPKRSR